MAFQFILHSVLVAQHWPLVSACLDFISRQGVFNGPTTHLNPGMGQGLSVEVCCQRLSDSLDNTAARSMPLSALPLIEPIIRLKWFLSAFASLEYRFLVSFLFYAHICSEFQPVS